MADDDDDDDVGVTLQLSVFYSEQHKLDSINLKNSCPKEIVNSP